MSEASLNGAANGVPVTKEGVAVPDWRKWISKTRCVTRLGVNSRRFEKLCMDGELPAALQCPDGTIRWDPHVIDAKVQELSDEGDPDTTADVTKAQADVAKAGAASMSVATNHVERMIQLLEKPTQFAMQQMRQANMDLRDENETLRERLHIVEDARMALITAREELLSEATAREIAQRQAAATDERKTKMFEIFTSRAPGVLDAVGKTLGVSAGDQVKVKAVIDLANDLDPALLETLAASGAMTESQIGHVEVIIGKKIPRPAKSEPQEETPADGTTK